MPATPAATALWEAWERCRAVLDLPARLARFAPARPAGEAHARLALEALSRGVSLLRSAAASKGALTDPWRFVIRCTGFELIARVLLDVHPRAELGREDFSALVAGCELPAYEPLPAQGAERGALSGPLAEYLGLGPAAARALGDWLAQRQPVADWCSALCLALAVREATTCGCLSAAEMAAWKLQPALERLLVDLSRVTTAALAALSEDVKRPARRVAGEGMPARPVMTRPVVERVPALTGGSEEEALVRAIATAPEDDVPRLVYADWLEEHDRGDHAAFIRAQCELARITDIEGEWGGSDRSERWEGLRHQCEALTPRREGAWSAPAAVAVEFHRGLPAFVTCGPRDFVDHGQEWLAAAPTLHGLRLSNLRGATRHLRALVGAEHLARFTRLWVDRSVSVPALAALLTSDHLAGLTDLDLARGWLRNTSALADAHHLSRLTRLELSESRLGDDRLVGLLRSPVVSRLACLGLQGNTIRDAGARALAACHRLAGLTTLNLSTNRFGTTGVQALASSPNLARLQHLDLSANGLGPAAARALAQATGLSALVHLDLSDNRLRDAGVRELVDSELLARLTRLDLRANDLTDAGVEALAASASLAGLRSLTLGDDFGNAGIRAVARSPHLAGLCELSIQGHASPGGLKTAETSRLQRLETLSVQVDKGPAALAACQLFGLPATLDLQGNSLGDAGAAALAAMPDLTNVVRLNLSFNGIGDRGIRALAESPYLGNLQELNLHYNRVGPAGAHALVAGAGLPRLTRLVLGSNRVKSEGLRRIAATPAVARLTSLQLWYIDADDAGVTALAESPHLANLRHLDLAGSRVSHPVAVTLMASPNLPRLGLLRLGVGLTREAFEALRVEAACRGITLTD
jgi:uncharacterized protein (TIGR02996 family)